MEEFIVFPSFLYSWESIKGPPDFFGLKKKGDDEGTMMVTNNNPLKAGYFLGGIGLWEGWAP